MPVPAQKPVTEPKTSYNVGDIFEFGSYPQSEVTDDAIKAALTAKSGSTDDWTSYNYYVSSAQSDYMKYTDVEYNGEKYRGVYFTIYRPCVTRSSGDAWNSAHYYNGYSTLTQYWFRYDPIKWQVLSFDSSTGNVIAMSKSILDSQQFYHYSSETRTIGGKTVYPNNYEHSDIRAWLNDAFYNTAFGETEKKAIIATTLDNSAYSADYKEYNSDSTTDNVWHLSYSELQNADYGFASNESASETRQAKGTAYAFCQGLEKNSWNDYSVWRSRTAGDMKKSVVYISSTGKINRCYDSIRDTNDGVRPALKVHLAPPVLEPIPVPTTNIDSTTNNVKPTDPVLIPTDDVPPTVDVLPTDYAVPTDDVAPTDYVPPTEDLAPTTEDSTTEPETEPATKPTAEPTTVPTTESTIEPTTAKREPITETVSPTEQEQTTISIDDVIASVAEKVDAVRAAKTDDGASALIAVCGINAAVIRNAASGSKIVDKDGKEVSDTAPLATGMKIVLDGETVEIAVLGDVDGNGEISVTDARLALRQAVSLENLKGVYLLAAKLGSDTVSVSEARKILRAAVGLDDSKDWLK